MNENELNKFWEEISQKTELSNNVTKEQLKKVLNNPNGRRSLHETYGKVLNLGTLQEFEKRFFSNLNDLFLPCALKKGTPTWDYVNKYFYIIVDNFTIDGIGSGKSIIYDNKTYRIINFSPTQGVNTWLKEGVTSTYRCTTNGGINYNKPNTNSKTTNKTNFIKTSINVNDVLSGQKLVVYGMEGTIVSTLQKLLINKGYKLAQDSKFGSKTLDAVKKFQTSVGLKADGKVGKNTWNKLTQNTTKGVTPRGNLQPLLDNYFERAVARFDLGRYDDSEMSLMNARKLIDQNPNLTLNNRANEFYNELITKSKLDEYSAQKETFTRMANLIKKNNLNENKIVKNLSLIEQLKKL